jgi:ATP-dependent DNA ligase
MRIHPAESRIPKLAAENPATLVVFDLLVDERGRPLVDKPLKERRPRLEAFAARYFPHDEGIRLSPATRDFVQARSWFDELAGGLDGIIAKRLDAEYKSGERSGMEKIKDRRTADCVVGGFRYAQKEPVVGSLLLGLYDDAGLLHHVGFTSSIRHSERAELTARLESLIAPPGFTGRAPGGPSRWSTERSGEWKPLAAQLVVEVEYDHFTGDRFRHGTKFCRRRPDKSPLECRMSQVERESRSPLDLLEAHS